MNDIRKELQFFIDHADDKTIIALLNILSGNVSITDKIKKLASSECELAYKKASYASDCLIQSSCMSFKTDRCNDKCKLYI